ncbi:hypothetical protein [Brumicola nitratireducens]|uniref:Uncharacterized protein n=1 Tax=Glaciecola nitratireducens (strain JCM 12485 / KCTC 12276 / FR1064) TaxID=1085623 RepID=G4QJX0_GLANF|nr:hypothetical protein [Glaciecola nitratireducens]AEP29013.1 hypothetical protein GNIT_0875 [Glaciecola nitratireducens FR1064]
MKYTKKTNINQTTPLLKYIPSLVAGVVIASLSASVTANQLNSKLQTPAQVEQALTALLDSRDATLQLAAYTSKQASIPVGQLVVRQAATKKVDHSQKSVAELVLAGLAITSEAKDELSSSAPTIEPAAAVAQDYAVADIVDVEELVATTNGNTNSTIQDSEFDSNKTQDASAANVDYSSEADVATEIEIQPVAQGVASKSTKINSPVSININELDEDALPAMPVSEALTTLNAEEKSEVDGSSTLVESNDQPERVETFAMSNTDEIDVVETKASASDIAAVEMETVEADVAEIAAVETEAVEAEVTEIAAVETEAVEAEVTEIAAVETEAVETEVTEIAVVEIEAVEAEVTEIAVVETEAVEAEASEIAAAEEEYAQAGVTEAKFVQSNIAEADVAEEVAPKIVELEESAPIQLASVSTSASLSAPTTPDSAQNSAPETFANDEVTNKIDANVTVATRSAGCPEDFNKVSIPVNGKMCQIFAADFPASMILFIPQTPEEVIQYYLASSANFVEPKAIKQRTMLKSADNNTTLIISKDGGGTQVDILVKSPVI